jgi:hypothetical protein
MVIFEILLGNTFDALLNRFSGKLAQGSNF